MRTKVAKENGPFTVFEEMETGMEISFPIQFVVLFFLKLSPCMQIDSESKTAKFVKIVSPLVYSTPKESSLSEEFLGFDIRSSDRHFSLFTACS